MLSKSSDSSRTVLDSHPILSWRNIYGFFKIGSIFQWTLIIFFVGTLPLILTVIYSLWSIQEYTAQGTELFLTIGVSNNNQTLVDELLDMDRNIRKYQVLEDSDYLTEYKLHHEKFVTTATQTNFFILPEKLQHMFTKLLDNELELYNRLMDKIATDNTSLIVDDFKDYLLLRTAAVELVIQGNKQIFVDTLALSELATVVQQQITKAALISVLLAFFLGVLLLYLINKPIKRIQRAIRVLGHAQFNKPIAIQGPRDVREVGEHLEWLRARLNQLENSKQFFIKTISHELKTPLATLMEGVDLLQDEVVGELNAEQHNITGLLQIANIRLNGLIENLIEYQKSTSTLAKVNYSKFNLNHLVDQICEDYQLILESKKVSVEFDVITPIDMVADRDKIRIVVSNLFSNALKFSPEGSQILFRLENRGKHVQMLIADQGPGIDVKQLPHIFTEFYKQPTPESWKIKGSGLGLSLVKDYVAAHEGQIKLLAPTAQYCGVHFLIILPLKPKKIIK